MPIFDPRIDQAGAQSLADLMGGGSAAQYLGGQQAMIEQMNPINRDLSLADLDKVTLSNDHNRVMNPMLQQVQRAEVRNADSKTPEYFTGMRAGELGTARSNVAKAKLDESTLDSNISAKNSANQVQMIQDMGKNMLNVTAYLGGLPPDQQREALGQLITHHGWDKNPATKAVWAKLLNSPNMLLEATNIAERMMDFNPEHLSRMATGRQTADSNELIHQRSDASREKVAGISAAAQRYAADARKKEVGSEVRLAYIKADPYKKLEIDRSIIQMALENTDDYVEFPDGTVLSTPEAIKKFKASEQLMLQRQSAGAQVGDRFKRDVIGIQPNGNGTGGNVPLADPLGIRK